MSDCGVEHLGNCQSTNDQFAIGLGVPADVEELAQVHRDAALVGYAHIFPVDAPKPTVTSLEALWLADIENSQTVVFVARRHEHAIGSAVLDVDDSADGVLLVKRLYVAPSRWGLGIGTALLDHVVEEARQRGAALLSLWVLEGNRRARQMYERRGWRFVPGPVVANEPPRIVDVLYQKLLR